MDKYPAALGYVCGKRSNEIGDCLAYQADTYRRCGLEL